MKQDVQEAETEKSANGTLNDTQKSSDILQALLNFIIERDALAGDPQFQHLRCLSSSTNVLSEPAQLRLWHFSKETIAIEPKISHNPKVSIANETYIGKNHQFLKVEPGDRVTVHAWIGETEVIGFNERNHTAGRISVEYLERGGLQQQKHPNETFLCDKSFQFLQDWEAFLVSRPGDRIRVCHWDNALKMSGTGFSLATGQIGRFSRQ